MINLILVLTVMMMTQMSFGQTKKHYQEKMESLLAEAETAKTWQEYEQAARKFANVFDLYSNKWEPRYYAAYYTNLAALNNEDVAYRVKAWKAAESYINMGLGLNIDNADMKFLKAYILTLKGEHLSTGLSEKMNTRIKELVNEGRRIQFENPRGDLVAAFYLYYHTNNVERAKKEATSSIEKFIEFKPANSIAPNWGRDMAEELAKKLH